jgi:A/G-specific adenine glycosylase
VLYTTTGVWLQRRPAKGLWGGLLSLPETETDVDVDTAAVLANLTRLIPNLTTLTPTLTLTPWTVPQLKHTFTHYQLHWTLWGAQISDNAILPEPWQHVSWRAVSTAGVPTAVLKALAQQLL